MRTEQEIREMIKRARLSIDDEQDKGGAGGDVWFEAVIIERTFLSRWRAGDVGEGEGG